MTDQDPNALIAKAMSADPDPQWEVWAWVRRSPERYHRIPRDFALPANMPRLMEWASGQKWWTSYMEWEGYSGDVRLHIEQLFRFYGDPRFDAAATALQVRDIIAAKLKEIEE